MSATRLSAILALSSLLSTSAIAAEPFSAEQEQSKLLQLQRGEEGPQGGDTSLAQETKEIWPQGTGEFSTYLFIKTNWKVHNPHGQSVQVNLRCARYGYDFWFWIAPYDTIEGAWGCEGRTLYIKNNAPQYSDYFIQATTW
jgi:hypothetical protein